MTKHNKNVILRSSDNEERANILGLGERYHSHESEHGITIWDTDKIIGRCDNLDELVSKLLAIKKEDHLDEQAE